MSNSVHYINNTMDLLEFLHLTYNSHAQCTFDKYIDIFFEIMSKLYPINN